MNLTNSASRTVQEAGKCGEMSAQCTFSEIQNLAKKFLERGHLLTLEHFLGYVGSENEKRLLKDTEFLMKYLNLAMKRGRFENVIEILKKADDAKGPEFLSLWDEAHYSVEQGRTGGPLTPIQKFRIRSRNPPPPGVCPDGGRPKTRMGYDDARVLVSWMKQHPERPYLTHADKAQLAAQTGLTDKQVSTWFSNARRKLKRKQGNQGSRQAKRSCASNRDAGTSIAVHHCGTNTAADKPTVVDLHRSGTNRAADKPSAVQHPETNRATDKPITEHDHTSPTSPTSACSDDHTVSSTSLGTSDQREEQGVSVENLDPTQKCTAEKRQAYISSFHCNKQGHSVDTNSNIDPDQGNSIIKPDSTCNRPNVGPSSKQRCADTVPFLDKAPLGFSPRLQPTWQQYNRQGQEIFNNIANRLGRYCYNQPAVVTTPVEREPFALIQPKPLQIYQNMFHNKSEATFVVERLASLRQDKRETAHRPIWQRAENSYFPIRSGQQIHDQGTGLNKAQKGQANVHDGNQASPPSTNYPRPFEGLPTSIHSSTVDHQNTNFTALQACCDDPRWTHESIQTTETAPIKYSPLTEVPIDTGHILDALQDLCVRVTRETVSPTDVAVMMVRDMTGRGYAMSCGRGRGDENMISAGERDTTLLVSDDDEGRWDDVYMGFKASQDVRELEACWNQPHIQEVAVVNQTTNLEPVDYSLVTELEVVVGNPTTDLEPVDYSLVTELEVVHLYPQSHDNDRTEELGCHEDDARSTVEDNDCVILHVEKPDTPDYGTTVLGEAIQGLLNLSSSQGSATNTEAVWSGHRLK